MLGVNKLLNSLCSHMHFVVVVRQVAAGAWNSEEDVGRIGVVGRERDMDIVVLDRLGTVDLARAGGRGGIVRRFDVGRTWGFVGARGRGTFVRNGREVFGKGRGVDFPEEDGVVCC